MDIKTVKVGLERTNCYIVTQKSGETLVIDPGDDADVILDALSRVSNLELKYILLTHGHFDHVSAVDEIKQQFPSVPVLIHEADIPLFAEVPEQGVFVGRILKKVHSPVEALTTDEFLPFGEDEIKIISTPGHTPGGVCFLIGETIFTGDTLFYHTFGRTDLPLSDEKAMRTSLDILAHLPAETRVYPGHGRATTIGEEVKNNPYLI